MLQAQSRAGAGQGGGQRPKGNGSLRRSVGYLGRQRRYAFYAYGALLIATAAQLLMPQFVQRMIDAVTNGWTANLQLNNPLLRTAATLTGKLDQLKLDAANAESLLTTAALLIVGLAVVRGLFAFIQAYMAERTSQGIAFDFRNEIFAKIQRLSFSYHDRNQTGQLMIRATDDVEKVRLFIAQGLVMAAQGLILLVCTLILEFAANWRLTLVVLPTLPIALVIFVAFGMIVQPLFTRVQQRISTLNTVLQESLAGIKVVKAFAREDYEQKRFDKAADSLLQALVKNAQILSFLFPLVFLV